MENTETTYEFEYIKFLTENNIKEQLLPTEIKQQIGILKAAWGRYKKNPSAAMKNNLVKQDVCVSDLIADYVEEGIEEKKAEEVEKKEETPAPNPPSDDNKDVEQKKEGEVSSNIVSTPTSEPVNHPKVETPKAQTPTPSNNSISPEVAEMVVKIKEKLATNNNIISTKDLKAIINRPPAEPTQQVGDVKLRKVFLRSEYKLV